MRLVTVGSFRWPLPLTDNQRDWRVLLALRQDWSDIQAFVKAPALGARQWADQGVTCHYLPAPGPGPIGSLLFVLQVVARVVRLHRDSPVALFSASDPVSAVAGAGVRTLTGVPLLVHVQGEVVRPPSAYGGRVRRAMLGATTRWACRRADAIRVVHAGQIAELGRLGIPGTRIHVATSRCDTTLYDPARWASARGDLRRTIGITSGVVAVYVGSLIRGKGVHVALEAWRMARDRLPDARFVVVGNGRERPALERLAGKLGLADVVHFAGAVSPDHVAAHLAAADIFVFPSFSEGSPRAVMEAMSMALPVVASDVGGIPDLIRQGDTGLLVPAGDPESLARELVGLAVAPERRARIGRAAREEACRRFAFRPAIDALRRLYLEAAGEPAPADQTANAR